MRLPMIGPLGLALILVAGCASDEALFARYERPCPVPGFAVPEPAMVVAVTATEVEPGMRILPAVFFDYRSARLDAEAEATLDRVFAVLDADPAVHLFLRAQTDARGSRSVNELLAAQRLASVRAALLARGVADERLRGVGIGEREAVEGSSAAVMDASRRVDLQFVDVDGRPLPIVLRAAGDA